MTSLSSSPEKQRAEPQNASCATTADAAVNNDNESPRDNDVLLGYRSYWPGNVYYDSIKHFEPDEIKRMILQRKGRFFSYNGKWLLTGDAELIAQDAKQGARSISPESLYTVYMTTEYSYSGTERALSQIENEEAPAKNENKRRRSSKMPERYQKDLGYRTEPYFRKRAKGQQDSLKASAKPPPSIHRPTELRKSRPKPPPPKAVKVKQLSKPKPSSKPQSLSEPLPPYTEILPYIPPKDPLSGLPRGVTQRPSGKWQSQIYFRGRSRYLGVFLTPQDAAVAYNASFDYLQPLRSSSPDGKTPDEITDIARKVGFRAVEMEQEKRQQKLHRAAQPARACQATQETGSDESTFDNNEEDESSPKTDDKEDDRMDGGSNDPTNNGGEGDATPSADDSLGGNDDDSEAFKDQANGEASKDDAPKDVTTASDSSPQDQTTASEQGSDDKSSDNSKPSQYPLGGSLKPNGKWSWNSFKFQGAPRYLGMYETSEEGVVARRAADAFFAKHEGAKLSKEKVAEIVQQGKELARKAAEELKKTKSSSPSVSSPQAELHQTWTKLFANTGNSTSVEE